MDLGQLQYSLFGTRHRTQRSILTTAAAMAILVIGGLLIFRLLPTSMRSASLGTQLTPPALDTLVPITVENAAQLAPLYTLGTGSLMNAVWSPDGQTIVLATTKGLYVQDANDLNAPGVRLPGVDGTRFSGSVIYSADSTRIAAIVGETLPNAAAMLGSESEKPNTFPYVYALMVWDAATGEVLAKIDGVMGNVVGFVEENTQVVTSTCAERVEGVCVDDQYALNFWQVASGQEIVEKRFLFFDETPYQYHLNSSVVISADGQLLVYNGGNGSYDQIHVVNLREPEHSFMLRSRGYKAFALTPDDQWLVVYDNNKGLMQVYDMAAFLADPSKTEPYSVHEFDVVLGVSSSLFQWIKFSADRSRLVMYSGTGEAVIVDPAPLFAQPGEFLGDASAFHQTPPDPVYELPRLFSYQQHLSPDGTRVLFQAIAGGTLLMHDLKTGEKLQQSDIYHPYYHYLDFTGQMLVGGQAYWPDGKSRMFDLSGQTPVESVFLADAPEASDGITGNAMYVRLSPGGRYALYQVGDFTTGTPPSLLWRDRHTGKSYKLMSVVGAMATAFTEDGSVLIFDHVSFIHRYDFTTLNSANGPTVTVMGTRNADSAVILQGAPRNNLVGMVRAAFSPDGRIIVMSTSNELHVYSTTTGARLAQLDGLAYPQAGDSISFSGDGHYVTAGGCVSYNTSTAISSLGRLTCNEPHPRVWDLTEVYALLETHPEIRPGTVKTLTITPIVNFPVDGTKSIDGITSFPVVSDSGETEGFLIAVGDFTQTRVWFIKTVNSGDAETAEPLLLATLPGEVQSLAFSSDETLLAVGGPGVVTLWGVAETVSQ